jgi:hypothetical protein
VRNFRVTNDELGGMRDSCYLLRRIDKTYEMPYV